MIVTGKFMLNISVVAMSFIKNKKENAPGTGGIFLMLWSSTSIQDNIFQFSPSDRAVKVSEGRLVESPTQQYPNRHMRQYTSRSVP
jgi:hypothetical protein